MVGLRPLARVSNSALVIVVLQSAGVLGVVVLVSAAGFTVAPFAAAAGRGLAGQTPSMVMTTALAGTDAELSGGGAILPGPGDI
jgi:hypothetical protein